jgi:nucleoside-diphosphate-sugar epimerase
MKTPRTVLVTGAAGFIGSHLALRAQSEWQADVIGVDCFTDLYDKSVKRQNATLLAAKGIRIVELDLTRPDLSLLPSVELIYHAAAEPGIGDRSSFDDYLRNNVQATSNLITWAKQLSNLELFVYLSTSSVYGLNATVDERAAPKPASMYGVTKLAAEQLCLAQQRQGALPACSCRLYSVYGPRERPEKLIPQLLKAAFESRPMPLYAGSERHRRSFTYVDDIVDGLLAAALRSSDVMGRIYNLGNPTTCTTAEIIERVENQLGRKIEIETLSPRAGDQLSTSAIIDAARADLGYLPSVDLESGIQRTIDWYAKNHVLQPILT